MSESKCSVLLLGGTGVMGIQLCDILASNDDFTITVTSRKERNSGKVKYIKGDAKKLDFLSNLISHGDFDVIVDFMRYTTPEFSQRVDLLLHSTKQYIYLSSARVYAESKQPLTESSPRLLDVCNDYEYLKTDEYALAKARQEDILYAAEKSNYTIVRPSITYGPERLQLGMSEKEEWLFRALCGNSVVLPKDMQDVKTTMTSGKDVATAISKLINNQNAIGETVHITSPQVLTWAQVAEVYSDVLKKETGAAMRYFSECESLEVAKKLGRVPQVKYFRGINRTFDGSKLREIIGEMEFTAPKQGLEDSLCECLRINEFKTIDWKTQVYFDRLAHEQLNVGQLSKEDRQNYYKCRYFGSIGTVYRSGIRCLRKIERKITKI